MKKTKKSAESTQKDSVTHAPESGEPTERKPDPQGSAQNKRPNAHGRDESDVENLEAERGRGKSSARG